MSSGNSDLYLSPDQQDLLLAALNSNAPSSIYLSNSLPIQHDRLSENHLYMTSPHFESFVDHKFNTNAIPTSLSPNSDMDTARESSFDGVSSLQETSPLIGDLDFPFDLDGNYEYELGIPDYENVESVATFDGIDNTTPIFPLEHEKRKSPPTDEETPNSQEGGNKKRGKENGEEKIPKKPGRKPITSEPTSKRKAQNRAAQRAFRERKEKHLKDLEDKVAQLEKESENANKENSVLRSQIEKLQAELVEYRKRLNGTKGGFSGILDKGSSRGFHFEFPMFGLSNKPALNRLPSETTNGPVLKGGIKVGPGTVIERQTPLTQTSSVTDNVSKPSSDASPAEQNMFPTAYGNSIVPSVSAFLRNASPEPSINMYQNTESQEENLRQSPASYKQDVSSSPSASVVSPHGTSSSCLTSPEPNTHSPLYYKPQDHADAFGEEINIISSEHDEPDFNSGVLDDGETSFCEKLGAISCGNPRNPVPLPPDSKLLPNLNEVIPRSDPVSIARQNGSNGPGTMPTDNLGQNAFTCYRDPTENAANLDMSIIDEASFMFPLGSPVRPASPTMEPTGEVIAQPEKQPAKQPATGLEGVKDDSDDDEDGGLIGSNNDSNLIPCPKIWDRIQSHPNFYEFDMERLCVELHNKARCSESGVLVGEKELDQVLDNAPLKHGNQPSYQL